MPRTGFPAGGIFAGGGVGLERRIRLPDGELCYTWLRKQVKNWNLRVHPDGTVALSTPHGVSGSEADRFIAGKAGWIAATRQKLAGQKMPRLQEGTLLSVAGRSVRLHLEDGGPGPARWEGDALVLYIPGGPSAEGEAIAVRDALRQALLDPARRELEGLLQACLPLVDAKAGRQSGAPKLTLRWMRSRWGSCMPGRNRITLNAALVLAPPDCAAYVVIHELCHRIHPDHSAAFHRLVGRVLMEAGLPDERTLRQRLRRSDAAFRMT